MSRLASWRLENGVKFRRSQWARMFAIWPTSVGQQAASSLARRETVGANRLWCEQFLRHFELRGLQRRATLASGQQWVGPSISSIIEDGPSSYLMEALASASAKV